MKLYDLECTLIHETEAAILVTVDDGEHKAWLPKSAVEIEFKFGNRIVVTAPESLLIDKELV